MDLSKFVKTYQRDIVFVIALILVFVSAYNIGKIAGAEKIKPYLTVTEPVERRSAVAGEGVAPTPAPTPADFRVVVSKSSSGKVYHFLWCPSVSKIKESNKVYFDNEQAAQAAGYKLAGNCSK
ncbi:MAG: hypothetical protein Q8Q06_03870 [bacterium]|nr:hypothetical protein [bacterium]